jgi:hypothetical protein
MDVFNALITTVKASMQVVQPGIHAIVGAFVAAMFLRGNTHRVEFEKIKIGKVQEAVDDLLKSRELTLTELVKCNNLLKIAEIADREYKNKDYEYETNTNQEFDFDWFLRFFDAAGNISNENMQLLWARILAGEVQNPGAFSLRTIETLRNMTQSEALLLHQISRLILISADGSKFVYRSDYIHSEGCKDDINELYGVGTEDFVVMEECGVLRPYKHESYVNFSDGSFCIYNGSILLMFQLAIEMGQDSGHLLLYNNYEVTQTANQLISIIDTQPDDNYILDLGMFFRKKYPGLAIKAHRITNIEGDVISLDFNTDLLDGHQNR